MKKQAKRMFLLLCLALMFSCFYIGTTPEVMTVKAATTVNKTIEMDKQNYAFKLPWVASAKYSFSYSKSGYVKYISSCKSGKKHVFTLELLKPGKVTVTVKRTYNKKTKKVATINLTITNKHNKCDYECEEDNRLPASVLYVQKGSVFALDVEYGDDLGLVCDYNYVTSSDTNVATVKGMTVTALETGTTTITLNGKSSGKMKLRVVDDSITTTDEDLNAKIKTLNSTKISSSTLASAYKQIAAIEKSLKKKNVDTLGLQDCDPYEEDEDDVDEEYGCKVVALAMPQSYKTAERKIQRYLYNHYDSGFIPGISKITKLTKSYAVITLKHAVTSTDALVNGENGKARFELYFSAKNGSSTACYVGYAKVGKKTFKAYYYEGGKVKKGSTYCYTLDNVSGDKAYAKTIKAK